MKRNEKDMVSTLIRKLPDELTTIIQLMDAQGFQDPADPRERKQSQRTVNKTLQMVAGFVRSSKTLRISRTDKPIHKEYGNSNNSLSAQSTTKNKIAKGDGRDNSRTKCFNCMQIGHWEGDCSEECRICRDMFGKCDKTHVRYGCSHKHKYKEWRQKNRQKPGQKPGKRGTRNQNHTANVSEFAGGITGQIATLTAALEKLTALVTPEAGKDEDEANAAIFTAHSARRSDETNQS
jgi:hypothetical protein